MANAAGGTAGSIYVALKVNGEQVPSGANVVRSMTMIEGTYTFPQLMFDFNDMHHLFEGKMAIVDGTQLTVIVGRSEKDADTLVFRVVGQRKYSEGKYNVIHGAAILDKNTFMYSTESYSKKANAATILADLAAKHKLKYKSTKSSDDQMTWVSLNESPRMFIEKIERTMWMGENTLPQTAVGLDATLQLVDLIELLDQQPKATFAYNYPASSSDIEVEDIREKSISGVLNVNQNYGSVTLVPNSKTGKLDQIKDTKMQSSKNINVSADVRESLAVTNIRHEHHDPVSEGAGANVHKNWYKAKDQWNRLAATFTEMCRVLVRGKHDLPLFSVVQLNYGYLDGSAFTLNPKMSGKWIVTGRTILLNSNGYSVAYLLSRNFTGEKGSTALLSDKGGSNKAMQVEPTLANVSRPTQLNGNVIGNLGKTISFQNDALSGLMSGFQKQGEAFGFPELKEKYGEGFDCLNALMSEFSLATLINSMCGALSELEKLTLDFSISNGPSILGALSSRMDACEDMLASFFGGINSLISNGDIPESYIEPPTINSRCNLNSLNDLNRAMGDSYPDKCMDGFSLDSLHAPNLDLSKYLRQLEEWFRKFLCAFGDGNVDGSADTVSTHVGITSDYR